MPFVEINVKNEIEKQKQNDPEFRKAWDDSRAEYRLIGEMISLRKQENITQKKLASLTGNKQQVISRIERKESIPTIRAFSQDRKSTRLNSSHSGQSRMPSSA